MILFSKRLKEVRKKANLTQEELGNLIGVTKVSICCYEKGTRTPTLDTLLDIANALNVDFKYLIGNDNFAVAEDDVNYGINISKDEINLIKQLRNHQDLYTKFLENPERMCKVLEQKIR